jgi:acetyl esterase
MPLDPQVREFLDEIEAMHAPPLETLPLEMARDACMEDARTLGDPEPVGSISNRTIPGPGGEIPIRVYQPANASQALPVFVYFHGGGWVVCNIDTHDTLCRSLANAANYLVVSVDYRLAPEHKFPAAVEDCFAATQWVREAAAEIGADPNRIVVGGDSAGGNLATVVSLMARDMGKPLPQLQVLIYPVTDVNLDTDSYKANGEGYNLTRSMMKWFFDCYLTSENDAADWRVSPLRAKDLSGLPPALVITAEFDPLRDEGEAYAARLKEAEVPVTLTRYDGMIHPFIRRIHRFDQARTAFNQVVAALGTI